MADSKELIFVQGKTFTLVVRWETEPVVRKAITGISFATGCPRLTVPAAGCPEGWRAAVALVKGPTALNAANNPPRAADYHPVTVIDANTVEFNDITPVDANGREWPDYISGGFLLYNTPVSLTGFTARMAIKAKAGESSRLRCTVGGTSGATVPAGAGSDGTVTWVAETSLPTTKEWAASTAFSVGDVIDLADLMFLASGGRIAIDASNKVITLTISATDTAAITWKKGVYDLELVSPTGVVTALLTGTVSVSKEVTT